MTDTQHFFNLARAQFDAISNDVERHFDQVASHLREWIPYDQTSQTISLSPPRKLPPPTTFQLAQRWVNKHKALSAAMVAFVLTGSIGAYVYMQQNNRKRKRRGRKSASGARTDVVVVAGGAVANPLTSALYLDLERRGLIVYVVVHTTEEENYIRSQNRADLLPLHIDLLDPFTAQDQMRRFHSLIGREHRAFGAAEPHRLKFLGLVQVPDTKSQIAERIEDIRSEEWSDALNAKVLNTIATTQLFLPSLVEQQGRVLLLTPSVMPALRMPGRGIESTVYGALEAFISSLRAEMNESGVGVTHFKLGAIDVPSVTVKQRRAGVPAPRLKATSQRRLHEAVFDALTAKRPAGTWRVGRGSVVYDVAGAWMPRGLVGWLVGGVGVEGTGRRQDGLIDEAVTEEGLAGSQGSLEWEKVHQDA